MMDIKEEKQSDTRRAFDDTERAIKIGCDGGEVVISLSETAKWSMHPSMARELSSLLLSHARVAEKWGGK